MAVEIPERTQERSIEKPSIQNAIGTFNLIILSFGSIVLLAAIVFLSLFWSASLAAISGRQAPAFWSQIVQDGHAPSTITIISVIIRNIITVQIGVVTSMVAALIIERPGVVLSKLACLSIARSVNTGPLSLGWQVLVRRPHNNFPTPHAFVLLVIIAFSIASQFASTILLLDFRDSIISLPQNTTLVPVGFLDDTVSGSLDARQGVNYWNTGMSRFPLFAEISEPVDQIKGVQDTGVSLRALLPFLDSGTRSSLRQYSGPARVMDARVICVTPLLSNLSISTTQQGTYRYRALTGNVTLGAVSPALEPTESAIVFTNFTTRFNCPIILPLQRLSRKRWTSLCAINIIAEIVSPPLGGADGTGVFLLFNATGFAGDWEDGPMYNWNVAYSQAWAIGTKASSGEDLQLSASLCFTKSFGTDASLQSYHVDIWTDQNNDEASIQLNLNDIGDATVSPNTINSICTSCIPPNSGHRRNTLQMNTQLNWTVSRVNVTNTSRKEPVSIAEAMAVGLFYNDVRFSENSQALIIAADIMGINRGHVAVFNSIMALTENPALGLQYLTTAVAQMAFYDFLPYFNSFRTANLTVAATVFIPHRWTGFGIVAGLSCLHLLTLGILVVLFLYLNKVTLLGNSWAAVLQVHSENIKDITDKGVGLSDDEVQKLLSSMGRNTVTRITRKN
jgi:hypothetical protein